MDQFISKIFSSFGYIYKVTTQCNAFERNTANKTKDKQPPSLICMLNGRKSSMVMGTWQKKNKKKTTKARPPLSQTENQIKQKTIVSATRKSK